MGVHRDGMKNKGNQYVGMASMFFIKITHG